MMSVRRAVIDVGTNSVKLLVADVAGHDVRPVFEDSKHTRLGSGFYETRRMQIEPIAYSANAVADFAEVAHAHGAHSIRVIATSAARDAVNPEDLISAIEAASKLRVEIISGELEAQWAFRGVTTDPRLRGRPLLLLDVGGGSTEFVLGQGDQAHFSASFPLGAVRLMEEFPHSDPPTLVDLAACRSHLQGFLSTAVQPKLDAAMLKEIKRQPAPRQMQLIGTGGTANALARIEGGIDGWESERIEATRLSLERLCWHRQRLWNLPLAERRKIVGLPPERADVILTGVLIYEAVMELFDFPEMRVSTQGLRFAALMDDATEAK
jgi:exopolyphosphatase/guanosine-5'-triphosphate,3'-diphosphate pyrophosphatase